MRFIIKLILVVLTIYGLVTAVLNFRLYLINLDKSREQSVLCSLAPTVESCLKQYQYLIEADKNAHGVVSEVNKLHNKVN